MRIQLFLPSTTHSMSSSQDFHNDTKSNPSTQSVEFLPITPPISKDLRTFMLASKYKLYFTYYTPEGTILRKWYLAQVDLDASESLAPMNLSDGYYYCYFLAKHPDDSGKSDKFSRWWPDWYHYSRDSVTYEIIFGRRTLCCPSINPDSSSYIQWGDSVKLSDTGINLLGPLEFELISSANRTRSKIAGIHWRCLYDECISKGILPLPQVQQRSMPPRLIKIAQKPGRGNFIE